MLGGWPIRGTQITLRAAESGALGGISLGAPTALLVGSRRVFGQEPRAHALPFPDSRGILCICV
jgi:hypothetical protein